MSQEKNNQQILDPEKWKEYQADQKQSPTFWKKPLRTICMWPYHCGKKRYNVRYKHNKKHLVFDILLSLLVLFMIVFNLYYFFGLTPLSFINQVDLEINFEQKLRSGDEAIFEITYQNNNKELLKNAVLGLRLPQGFSIEKVEPYALSVGDNTISIGDINPGGSGSVTVTGQLYSDINIEQKIETYLTYDKVLKDDHTLRLSSLEKKSIIVDSSVLRLEMKRKPALILDHWIPLTFEVFNDSTMPVENIIIDHDFLYKQMSVRSENEFYDSSLNRWVIPSLDAQSSQTINFEVWSYKKLQDGATTYDKNISAFFQYGVQNYYQGVEINFEGEYIDPQISAQISLVEDTFIAPNKEYEFSLEIANNESVDIFDIEVPIHIPLKVFNLPDEEPLNRFYDYYGLKRLTYEEYPALSLIEAGQTKEITFTLKTLADFQTHKFEDARRNILITLGGNVNYKSKQSDKDLGVPIIESQFKLGTDMQLQAHARYFSQDEEQLGRGPYPPIIGEPTTYWLGFEIYNTSNEVQDVVVEARLPEHVRLTERFLSLGEEKDITYDEARRVVIWKVTKVAAYAGLGNEAPAVNCEIEAIPDRQHEGEFVPLVEDITITGVDSFTNGEINQNLDEITTELPQDEKAQFKGGKALLWE